MTDKPWSKELGLMFVELCVGLGFLRDIPGVDVVRGFCRAPFASWEGLLVELTIEITRQGKSPQDLNVHGPWGPWIYLACGPAPSQKLDIQTAALVLYLGEALGWPPLDG